MAVLVVVAFHSGLPLPGGFIGVDVFFVISGFVITAMLRRQSLDGQRVRLGSFYFRRFQRLMPALAVMVVVVLVASVLILSPVFELRQVSRTALGALLLSANVVIARYSASYFDPVQTANPLLNTWSLSVEEQFYLFFPPLLVAVWWLARGHRRLVAAVLVAFIAVTSFGFAMLGSTFEYSGRLPLLVGFYSPLTRAWEFAVGALLALLIERTRPRSRASAVVPGAAGLAVLLASTLVVSEATPFPGPWTLLPVAGAVLVIWAGSGAGNPVSRVLGSRPMVAVGDWSYSIYLWHWPVIALAVAVWPTTPRIAVIAAAASFAPAIASYAWLEQPIRRRRFTAVSGKWVLVTATMVPALAIVGVSLVMQAQAWGPPIVKMAQLAAWTNRPGDNECISTVQKPVVGGCLLNAGSGGAPIYLVGDSNAAMYVEGALESARQLDRPLVILTMAGCPAMDVYLAHGEQPTPEDRACRTFYGSTMDRIASGRPGTVVIGTSTGYWSDDELAVGRTPDGQVGDPAARSRELELGLRRTVTRLQDSGNDVVLVSPVYRFDRTAPVTVDRCSTFSILRGTCPESVLRSDVPSIQQTARAVVEAVANDAGTPLVDIVDRQCPEGRCSAVVDGTYFYMDTGHISEAASRATGPGLAQAIEAADDYAP